MSAVPNVSMVGDMITANCKIDWQKLGLSSTPGAVPTEVSLTTEYTIDETTDDPVRNIIVGLASGHLPDFMFDMNSARFDSRRSDWAFPNYGRHAPVSETAAHRASLAADLKACAVLEPPSSRVGVRMRRAADELLAK